MSNLRQEQSLLEENISLKRDQKKMNDQIGRLLSDIHTNMNKMNRSLEELKKRPSSVTVIESPTTKSNDKSKTVNNQPKPFIPTADTRGMKANVAPIEKTKRKTNLHSAAKQLSKLQKPSEVK